MAANRIEGRTEVLADWAWQAFLVTGVCSVMLGIVVTAWPDKSGQIAGTLFGLVLTATAAVQAILAFGARISTPLRWLEAFGATLAMVLALWSFDSGGWVILLGLWTGMGWAVRGIVQAIVAAWSEGLEGSVWQEVAGLVTLGAGIAVILGFESMTALSIAVGLFTIVLGVSEVMLAVRIERDPAAPGIG